MLKMQQHVLNSFAELVQVMLSLIHISNSFQFFFILHSSCSNALLCCYQHIRKTRKTQDNKQIVLFLQNYTNFELFPR